MVVAGQRQHTAQRTGARAIGVAQHVAAAVHTGALAVPNAEYAVNARTGKAAHMLSTPDGGGGQVFVDCRAEENAVFFQDFFGLPHVHVVAAQR